MTQPQRGSSREEVSDLRNIVDRLDLLMGSPAQPTGRAGGRTSRDEAIMALGERVETLEGEVEELRTLVNHLMTIATWQAKVTATLVDDRDDDTPVDDAADPVADPQQGGGRPQPDEWQHDGDAARRGQRHATHATALDEDIDDILGAERGGSHHDTAPPDFGI